MLASLGLLVLLLAALAAAAGLGAGLVFALSAACCGAVAALAIFALVAGSGAESLVLPVGPAFAALRLALDPLTAWFALIVALSCLSASLHALAGGAQPPRVLVAWPLFLAAMLLAVLAGDGVTLLAGFTGMSLAAWPLVAGNHRMARGRWAARLHLGIALASGLGLLGAFALVAPPGDPSFAALRAAPPEGAVALAFLALVLVGAGATAGLVPLHPWLPLAHPAAPAFVSAAMGAAMVKVAIYVLLRALLDLAGPQQPGWWGLPLVAAGAAAALLGALRANLETESQAALAASATGHAGLIVLAIGLALLFRGADLGPLAALALTAALLHALAHGLFQTLLCLGAGEVRRAAGAREMDRSGGLAQRLPRVAIGVAIGAASAAALPPLAGFAGMWLLLQALLAGWRVGDLLTQAALAAALAVAAMAAALGAAAMLRLFALVFLGRPRLPRAAGAEDARGVALAALALPALLALLAGLFAAPLAALAEGPLRAALGAGARAPVAGGALPLALAAPEGDAIYAPLAVLALLALLGLGLVFALRRVAPAPAARRAAVWDGGFAAPPPELPFGDPRTQPSAAGLAQPLRRRLGASLLGARERLVQGAVPTLATRARGPGLAAVPRALAALRDAASRRVERPRALTPRQCLGLGLAALALLLALVAWLERQGA